MKVYASTHKSVVFFCLFTALLFGPCHAAAQDVGASTPGETTLEKIDTSSGGAEPRDMKPNTLQAVYAKKMEKGVEITVKADNPIKNYKAFTIDDPARIVFDISGLTSDFKREHLISVNSKWAKSVRYYGYPNRVRLVVDTEKAYLSDYESETVADGLVVKVGSGAQAEMIPKEINSSSIDTEKAYLSDYESETVAGRLTAKIGSKAQAEMIPKEINSSSGGAEDRYVTIDFNNVDIEVFIKFISELTGENFVVDNQVKGKVTVISPRKISLKEAYKVFESVLEVHGYSAVKAGEVIKIVSATDARTKSIETRLREEAGSPEDNVVTHLIPLTYANADEIKQLFAPLVSKSSVILSYPQTNMLIITDVYSNIIRLMEIIRAIDISGMGQEISVIPLQYSDAEKLVKVLDTIFKSPKRIKKGETEKEFQFVADERTNTIVMLASEVDTERITKLIGMLDKEMPRSKEKIHVVYLENADAEELAAVLLNLPTKQADEKGKKETPVISEKVMITADKATNSLIILAEKDDYLAIEEIIKKLDIPRAMVYIESLIMEVNAEKDFQLGTEWTAAGEVNIDGEQGVVGGGFGGSSDYNNLANLTTAAMLPSGFSLGVLGEAIEIGGISFSSLAAIVQAYKKDKDVHILSTPQILTTDNEEAKIVVGKNVPFQTKSAADSGTETYSSYEYKDVGITLQITPQISKDRMVRLNIFQEVTKLDELSTTSTDRPTTLKRTIETTTIVQDGHTVVIGGLIDDSFSDTDYRVPCLGDVPGLGWLFRSKTRSNEKTNLFVFITPRVIEHPPEAESLYKEKKTQINDMKKGQIKLYDDNGRKTDASQLP